MKVLILAGGFGTRLSEETGIRPKPISTIGLGLTMVSSDNLVPKPPAKITTFIL